MVKRLKNIYLLGMALIVLALASFATTSCNTERYITYEDGEWDDGDNNEIYIQLGEMDLDDQDR